MRTMGGVRKRQKQPRHFKAGLHFSRTDALCIFLVVLLLVVWSHYHDQAPYWYVSALAFLGAVGVVGTGLCCRFIPSFRECALTNVALPVVLMTLCICMSAFFPLGTVPDEGHHFLRSYKYSNYLLLQDPGSMRKDDFDALMDPVFSGGDFNGDRVPGGDVSVQKWQWLSAHRATFAEDPSIVDASDSFMRVSFSLSEDLPQVRLASGLGIALARLLNLSTFWLFYVGRLFGTLYAVLLVWLAVRLTPVGKKIFIACALLPITIQQMGVYSADAAVIGLCFLLTSRLLRAICAEDKLELREVIQIVAIALLLAPCKLLYIAVLLLVFLIPARRFRSEQNARKVKMLFAGAAIVVFVIGAALAIPRLLGTGAADAEDYRQTTSTFGDYGYFWTFNMIACEPLRFLALLRDTFFSLGDNYIVTTLGGSLGNFTPILVSPWYVNVLLLGLLAMGMVPSRDDGVVMMLGTRLTLGVTFSLVLLASLLALLVTWTFTTDTAILGFQGRYVIPVLPCLLLALRGKVVRADCSLGHVIVIGGLFMNVFILMNMVAAVLVS